jgi:hypothetical protein
MSNLSSYAHSSIAALSRRTGRTIDDLTELCEERAAIHWENHSDGRRAETEALTDMRRMADQLMKSKAPNRTRATA